MAWVKLDDRFFTHPKALAAGPLGCQMFLAGLTYCASHLTDGWLSDASVRIVAAQAQVHPKVADKLVEVGFWTPGDGGFQVHDYLDWNPSRDQAREASEQARAAAHARWNPASNARGNARGNASRMQTAMPSRPVPSNSDARAPLEPFEDDFNLAWQDYPRKKARKAALGKYQAARRKGVAAEDLALAVKHYAIEVDGREDEYILHGATFFGPQERWRDYLEPPTAARNGQEKALGWDPGELRR